MIIGSSSCASNAQLAMDAPKSAEEHANESSDDNDQFYGELRDGDRELDDLEGLPDDQPQTSSDDEESNDDALNGGSEPGERTAQPVQDDALQASGRHRESVFAVAWNPVAESTVASGGGDDKAFLFQVGTDAHVELDGHTDSVSSMAFSSDGKYLATGGLDGQVKIWDASEGSLVRNLEGPDEGITWLQWHPRGAILIAGSEDFTCWMWNVEKGICMQMFIGHSGAVTCGSFTPDGRAVVTGGGAGDATLRAWSPQTGECTSIVSGHSFHQAGITCLAVNASGVAVSGAEDGTVRLSNIDTGRVLGAMKGHEDSVEAVAFAPTLGTLVVSAGLDGKGIVWDTTSLDVRATCVHPQGIVALACHPTAPFVCFGGLDGVLRLWDLRIGECIYSRTGHADGIQCLALSPDGQFVITGSDDASSRIFSIPTPT